MNFTDSKPHIYTANEVSLMLAALGAAAASIIYSFKHIKSSSCLGSKCEQTVTDAPVIVNQQPVQQSNV